MDLEIPNERTNWLETWRVKAGFCPEMVDENLGFPLGTTEKYEMLGLVKVSMFQLAKLIQLYRVNPCDFIQVIQGESDHAMRSRQ